MHIDILVHAGPGSSGSLIRLLKSISKADYSCCSIPHLTVELPQKMDEPTQQYLKTFEWPPARFRTPASVQQLSLRKRIPRGAVNEEESSARFLVVGRGYVFMKSMSFVSIVGTTPS